jgi:predicted adenine nucleotide alpha hydrolase (AANH) superfamily ATPase
MKKLLIHICCAPCLAYPYEELEEMKRQGEVESIAGIFYNPNIHPEDEFERRKDAVRTFAEMKDLPVEYFADFEMRKWLDFKGAKDERCLMCYSGRLEKTASHAAANGFDAFTTSLLVSPYQNHEIDRGRACEEIRFEFLLPRFQGRLSPRSKHRAGYGSLPAEILRLRL